MMSAIVIAVFSMSYIQLVISQCPQECQSCSDINQCLACKEGRWGSNYNCVNMCSNNCTRSDCDDNGYCYACVDGAYGPRCEQDCQLCKNGYCGLRECTSGCKTGYFQYIIGDYSYCYPCQDNCQQCQNFTYCTLCDTGYYIFKYTQTTVPKRTVATCTTCQANDVCYLCSQLSNCLQCSFSNGNLSCEHCVEGYTLDNSQCVKNIPCSVNCLTECTPNGECQECKDGTTGRGCLFNCYNRCAKCSQTNQQLCQACINGFYTSTCDIPCPQNCATRQCDFNNGSCLNGCLPGFWGDKCEDICSDHCTLSECNRDGTCSHGCLAAYGGLYCNITTPTTKTTILTSSLTSELVSSYTHSDSSTGLFTVCNCQDGRLSIGPVLGGAVTGAVVITALLVGSIAFFLHRRTVSKTSNREIRTDTMYYNTVGRSSVYEDDGQNINKASKLGATQIPEISVYDQLSRPNTEHEYSGL